MKKLKIRTLQILIVIGCLFMVCPITLLFYTTKGIGESILWVFKSIYHIFKSIYLGYIKGSLQCLKMATSIVTDMIEHYDKLKGDKK